MQFPPVVRITSVKANNKPFVLFSLAPSKRSHGHGEAILTAMSPVYGECIVTVMLSVSSRQPSEGSFEDEACAKVISEFGFRFRF